MCTFSGVCLNTSSKHSIGENRMARRPTMVLRVLLALSLCGRVAQACSCAPATENDMVQRATLAVMAQAITDAPFKVWTDRMSERVSAVQEGVTLFRVLRIVTGRLESERIAVVHNLETSACGLRFRSGERYLLTFRSREPSGKPVVLRAGLCHVKHQNSADTSEAVEVPAFPSTTAMTSSDSCFRRMLRRSRQSEESLRREP